MICLPPKMVRTQTWPDILPPWDSVLQISSRIGLEMADTFQHICCPECIINIYCTECIISICCTECIINIYHTVYYKYILYWMYCEYMLYWMYYQCYTECIINIYYTLCYTYYTVYYIYIILYIIYIILYILYIILYIIYMLYLLIQNTLLNKNIFFFHMTPIHLFSVVYYHDHKLTIRKISHFHMINSRHPATPHHQSIGATGIQWFYVLCELHPTFVAWI